MTCHQTPWLPKKGQYNSRPMRKEKRDVQSDHGIIREFNIEMSDFFTLSYQHSVQIRHSVTTYTATAFLNRIFHIDIIYPYRAAGKTCRPSDVKIVTSNYHAAGKKHSVRQKNCVFVT